MADKKAILAIDDDPVQLKMFRNILDQNYNVWTANSATNAIKFLNANKVDVILLDISMPNITGFEFLSDIRKIPSYMEAPIIIVSGNTGAEFYNEARNSSAFDVLGKPVEPDILISAIKRALTEVSG